MPVRRAEVKGYVGGSAEAREPVFGQSRNTSLSRVTHPDILLIPRLISRATPEHNVQVALTLTRQFSKALTAFFSSCSRALLRRILSANW
jgi:hypothetical protein